VSPTTETAALPIFADASTTSFPKTNAASTVFPVRSTAFFAALDAISTLLKVAPVRLDNVDAADARTIIVYKDKVYRRLSKLLDKPLRPPNMVCGGISFAKKKA
jgi:hypothetical protein